MYNNTECDTDNDNGRREFDIILSCLKGSGFDYWAKSATVAHVFLGELSSEGNDVFRVLP